MLQTYQKVNYAFQVEVTNDGQKFDLSGWGIIFVLYKEEVKVTKKNLVANGSNEEIETEKNTMTIKLKGSDADLEPKVYDFQIGIFKGEERHLLVEDRIEIQKSFIKWD